VTGAALALVRLREAGAQVFCVPDGRVRFEAAAPLPSRRDRPTPDQSRAPRRAIRHPMHGLRGPAMATFVGPERRARPLAVRAL
jgi:hypothetical protein